MKRSAVALFVALNVVGCASMPLQARTPRPLPTELRVGRLSETTAFERGQPDGSDASSDFGSSDPTPVDDGAPAQADGADHDTDDDQDLRKALFIAGVVASAVGGAMAIGFGAAGQITENRLDDAYASGLSRADESDFQDRGKAFNGVAIGGAAIAVVGISLTTVVLGLDYTRCGNLLKKRRKECRK